ncbi:MULTISPECIES: YjjG family noncanonical pyrimidine nucleotidase [Enterococcus]|uniref:Noncanonical pyrimidine nucleotidase, YjjG family protein n=1 Tax=Enterococcus alcedinis TaxID=1274384 RepID=A0A917N5A8_9ENTE|nr:YjjG family noncanonical pyrimidine nucleotidase [Enterococcus alcedinis]MBP2103116.1 2-haloacid dehalogenase [Enterococcus alcedinis]GGI66678.1 noncanonical pyrimidine nucleotidase, YjjG family protein [Enterococcus alcedinis]
MRYTTLLFDVDDTLLDFQAAENQALRALFQQEGIELTTDLERNYKELNERRWRAYELGQMSREEVVNERFGEFFSLLNRSVDSLAMEYRYRELLGQGHQLLGNSLEIVADLANKADLYIVSNGVSTTQYQRLEAAQLLPYFKEIIISEDTGYQKPMLGFFEYTFNKIPQLNKDKTVIIGDSLTSDIQGGHNAGIDTIWLHPVVEKKDLIVQPTHHIQQLEEIYEILK